MDRHEEDTSAWTEHQLPPSLSQLLDNAAGVVAFGISQERELAIAGYNTRVTDVVPYASAMAEYVDQMHGHLLSCAQRRSGMLDVLRTRSAELADEIELAVENMSEQIEEPLLVDELVQMVRDLVGLLGTTIGQLRALECIRYNPNDMLGDFILEGELHEEAVRRDAVAATAGDGSDEPDTDGDRDAGEGSAT